MGKGFVSKGRHQWGADEWEFAHYFTQHSCMYSRTLVLWSWNRKWTCLHMLKNAMWSYGVHRCRPLDSKKLISSPCSITLFQVLLCFWTPYNLLWLGRQQDGNEKSEDSNVLSVNKRACVIYRKGQKHLCRLFLQEAEVALEKSSE
jgi:hypothetical protein